MEGSMTFTFIVLHSAASSIDLDVHPISAVVPFGRSLSRPVPEAGRASPDV